MIWKLEHACVFYFSNVYLCVFIINLFYHTLFNAHKVREMCKVRRIYLHVRMCVSLSVSLSVSLTDCVCCIDHCAGVWPKLLLNVVCLSACDERGDYLHGHLSLSACGYGHRIAFLSLE
jgi:hypothetical protein